MSTSAPIIDTTQPTSADEYATLLQEVVEQIEVALDFDEARRRETILIAQAAFGYDNRFEAFGLIDINAQRVAVAFTVAMRMGALYHDMAAMQLNLLPTDASWKMYAWALIADATAQYDLNRAELLRTLDSDSFWGDGSTQGYFPRFNR